ncbi:uncharacterized protein BXZ73DRAFT_97887 [Epithele typhae]|uniref:uncharacterized protein n=1 Tax=Epithele typhae TaxID=378194 RepID=UPI002008AC2A|nr:uncharacterized protein BXZ73DRAFT_97887 [Epithele typhae]KAH9942478.1 hypothetical protein BXZ73DRAFT_97887 [Epithele typhae]
MVLPLSWLDPSPLQHPYLASMFVINTSRNRAWVGEFARDICEDKPEMQGLRAIAAQWNKHAFERDPSGGPKDTGDAPLRFDQDAARIFIKFYYTLHRDGESAAVKIVNAEFKRRGFDYAPKVEVSTAVPPARQKMNNRRTLGKKKKGSANVSEKGTNAASTTGDALPLNACLVLEEEENKEITTFATDRELNVFLEPQDARSGPPSRAPSFPSTSATLAASSSSTTLSATDVGMSLADPALPPSETTKPLTKRVFSANTPRERHPRNASHPARLKAILEAESPRKLKKLKRGITDDFEEVSPAHGAAPDGSSVSTPLAREVGRDRVVEDKSKGIKKPKKKVAASEDQSEARMDVEEPGPSSSPVERGIKKPRPKSGTKKPKKDVALQAAHASKDGKGLKKIDDLPSRPTKKQRGKDSEAICSNPIDQPDAAMKKHARKSKASKAVDDHKAGPSQSVKKPTEGRKRKREPEETHNGLQTDMASAAGQRMTAPKPKRVKQPKARANKAPVPVAGCLGIPADVKEMNQILKDGSTEALMILHSTETIADPWGNHPEAKDFPPDSDDEDSDSEVDWRAVTLPPEPRMRLQVDLRRRRSASPFSLDRSISMCRPVASHTSASGSLSFRAIPPRLLSHGSTLPSLPKPPLLVQPVVWARSRQEVCEAFDWFRSYQGGVYFADNIVKGYLLSAFSSARDMFHRGGRLIISHGGGKAESLHHQHGQSVMRQASDQLADDKSVRALLNTYRMKLPVALVIDDRYALFPYDLSAKPNCTYAVLGFYHISHVWAEPHTLPDGRGAVVRYKFAFEWCEKQPAPWWHQQDSEMQIHRSTSRNTEELYKPYVCPGCKKASPQVYKDVRVCLQPACGEFWRLLDGSPPLEPLEYDERFLDAPYDCSHGILEDIAPSLPVTDKADGVITTSRFAKGWHCKKCGRLSSRYKWQHWECAACGNTLRIEGKNRVPKDFWGQKSDIFWHYKVSAISGILCSGSRPYRVDDHVGEYFVYTLPERRGRIFCITGSVPLNKVANEIFEEYQNQAKSGELQLRRWPLRMHQCRGELLTNYFSQNTGEPYQYVGGTNQTVPFSQAPESGGYQFNEVLSAAYMEEQRMAFHSDAEAGLGPRVASLSLGSAALMHFRLLKKYRTDKAGGDKVNALTLFLRHGDVLIMDGAEIQEYYEHTVVPFNFRIAATARYIGGPNSRAVVV